MAVVPLRQSGGRVKPVGFGVRVWRVGVGVWKIIPLKTPYPSRVFGKGMKGMKGYESAGYSNFKAILCHQNVVFRSLTLV